MCRSQKYATLVLLMFLVQSFQLLSQSTTFDVRSYKEYLRTHNGIAVSSILNEYPSPVFKQGVFRGATAPAYLDSVITKFRLTPDEQDLLLTNGLVVCDRLQTSSISWGYYDIWYNDIPVLITTDAILHAVHSSYDLLLQDLESGFLSPRLGDLLEHMQKDGLPRLDARYGRDPRMTPMLRDIDVYLAVARRLLDGWAETYYPDDGQSVNDILTLIDSRQPGIVALFSTTPRDYDFSQFEPRGHYTDDIWLRMYFQAMIWLGRTEFMLTSPRLDGPLQYTEADIRRQVIDAHLMNELVRMDSTYEKLQEVEDLLRFFIGESDNVTAGNLESLRRTVGFQQADELLDDGIYSRWRCELLTKSWAAQRINSQLLVSDPLNPEQAQPPAAFLLLGQRFLIDSYIMQNVAYDRIVDGGEKVRRMMPSSMDVLFALGNNAAAQLLADEIGRYRYGKNLAGLRYLVDSYPDEFWNSSIYNLWLNGIRSLNPPDDLGHLPVFMQTAAWWQEKMNTQLASWAQLRHDNLLYGKQSYGGVLGCSYPYGYVEPIPAFFGAMKSFGEKTADYFDATELLKGFSGHFRYFAAKMDTLRMIAEKELALIPLSGEDDRFIKTFLFARETCVPILDGWYLQLCYRAHQDKDEPVIADVHTAPSDENGSPVGWILHAGTTPNNLGFVIAPSGEGTTSVYAGVMLGYSEYTTTNFKRLTDEEWRWMSWKRMWSRPDWVNIYLADSNGRKQSPAPSLTAADDPSGKLRTEDSGSLVLYQNYPNPFRTGSGTLIQFSVPSTSSGLVHIAVFDIMGRKIATILDRDLSRGTYMARWDGRRSSGEAVAPGMYFIRCTAPGSVAMRRVVVK